VNKRKKIRHSEDGTVAVEVKLSPEERQAMARKLKEERFGKRLPDVRDF